MIIAALVLFLKVVSLLGSALTACKLYRSGLYRRYPVFFTYFVFRVPDGIWPFVLDIKSPAYQKAWILTEPVLWAFYILLVFELYRLVLEKYKGLYTLGRWAMYGGIFVSAAVSALSMILKIKPSAPQRSNIFGYLLAAERGIDLSLAIFILVILFFLSRYPVALSRNVRLHAILYSIYFLSNTFGILMRGLFGLRLMDEVDLLLMSATAGCVMAWLFLLTPAGELGGDQLPRLNGEHERRLLTQLDALNSALVKARGA
jgi:hypothetical protein